MLISLHVKNLALIEETEVFLGNGLNILTGETGAGKSIIIGSISLALGAKAERDIIRTGSDYALIELIFQVNEGQKKALSALGIELEDAEEEEENVVVVSRRIMPGKSLCRVNGESVTTRQLREISSVMLDLYGQHDHQKLLQKKQHMEILDGFAGEKMEKLLEQAAIAFKELREIARELEESEGEDSARGKDLSLAEFEVNEIEEAGLTLGEDKELEVVVKKCEHSKRILEAVGTASELLAGDHGPSASDAVSRSLREISGVTDFDPALEDIESQLRDIESLLDDCRRSLSGYRDGVDLDEETFVLNRERLDLIHRLKDKYGDSIEQILAYKEERQGMLDKYADYDAYLSRLRKQKEEAENAYDKVAAQITELRRKTGKKLKKSMEQVLPELNFTQVIFEVDLQTDPESRTAKGVDEATFLISTNPGEPVKPLGNVASGGELSRIMLGLKTIMAQKDSIDTLIFDEIDAGISGRTAWQVARRLGILAGEHQVICITHLPQIAAMADTHFRIEKSSDKKQTTTRILRLPEDESIRELARLLGSDTMTDAVLSNAREMKQLATEQKADQSQRKAKSESAKPKTKI